MIPQALRDDEHGPLPGLLIALTFVTGLVDAASFLALGRAFVANMTGNVVFLGFAFAGVADFTLSSPLLALAAFLVGALAGGRLAARYGGHRGRLLAVALAIECALLAFAFALALVAPSLSYPLTAVLALAMGVQNAAARHLHVPDLTTTVMTQTLTALASESTLAGGRAPDQARRIAAPVALVCGAALGALAVLAGSLPVALAITFAVLTLTLAAALRAAASTAAWTAAR